MADDVATSSGVSDKADRCGWDNFRLLHEEVVATDSFNLNSSVGLFPNAAFAV